MKKKKKKINKKKVEDKGFVRVLGIKIKTDTLIKIIIGIFLFSVCGILEIYSNYMLENGKTEIVIAKIIDVGTRTRGGLGAKPKIGYIKYRYYVQGKEFIRFSESFYIRDNIEQYNIGDCIELLVSLEDDNIVEWNKSKGTFKCPEIGDN